MSGGKFSTNNYYRFVNPAPAVYLPPKTNCKFILLNIFQFRIFILINIS